MDCFVNFGARVLSSVCAPKDVEERKAEWQLEVEQPAVRENSADRCAGSSADHVAANVFHLAPARRKRACRIDGERLLQPGAIAEPAKDTVSAASACRSTLASFGPSSW